LGKVRQHAGDDAAAAVACKRNCAVEGEADVAGTSLAADRVEIMKATARNISCRDMYSYGRDNCLSPADVEGSSIGGKRATQKAIVAQAQNSCPRGNTVIRPGVPVKPPARL
jgi:hypothetical protein